MNTTKNISLLVLSVLVFLVVLGGFIFLVGDITARGEHITSRLKMIDEITRKDQEYQLFEKIIKSTEADRAKISSYVVKKDGLVDFIKLIEGMANSSGVEVSIKTVEESEVSGQASSTPKVMLTLPLTTTGTWENTAMFLALLESMPYKTTLTKVDLRKMDLTEGADPKRKNRFSKANPGWQADFQFGVLKFK
ncbi:hypothetical protein EPO17_03070 [Patescibacteria group bacterium]|nr:MAG: hypothetical protein EPO17_03070 [Patescibacteria group bacterium]